MLANVAQWSGFQWIGIGVAALALLAVLACVTLAIVAAWQAFGPDFICRRPETEMVLSTYRGDVRTGEGRRVKCQADMRITYMVGVSWRYRWLFGVIVFAKDSE